MDSTEGVFVHPPGAADATPSPLAPSDGLEARAAVAGPAAAGSGETLARDEDVVERGRRRRATIRATIAAHSTAPLDPVWAPAALARLRPGLDVAVERSGATVVDATCRTITCVATIEWPSYGAAQETYAMLLTQVYDLNCQRTILVDPPADPTSDGPYRSELYFDCTDEAPVNSGI